MILNLPKSPKVKLLFCSGVKASGIGKTSAIDNKFLWLNDNGRKDIGALTPITVPFIAQTLQSVVCMSEEVFDQCLRVI